MLLNVLWSRLGPTRELPQPTSDRIGSVVHLVYGLWDGGRLPWRYRAMLGSWRRHHRARDWRVVLWDRARSEAMLAERFPELLEIYQGYRRPIQRADLLRYLLLYSYGGFYADLDVICLRSLDGMLRQAHPATMVVQVEKILTPERAREIGDTQPIRQGRPELEKRIANYFLGCRAGHPTMAEIIELTRQRSHLEAIRDYDVLYTTGPDVVSEVIHNHREDPDLCILPREAAESYARHHCWGSWRQP